MENKIRTSIIWRIILLIGLSGIIVFSVLLFYSSRLVQNNILPIIEENKQDEVTLSTHRFEVVSDEVRRMVQFLKGTPPIQGMIRAEQADGIDTIGASTSEQWKERLASIFTAEMKASDMYSQLRFIDENGQEVVRVNKVDGVIFTTPEEELQNKASREYFISARRIDASSVYVSQTELNREGNPPVISMPLEPILRFASPVFSEITGEFEGILIANVFVDHFISVSGVDIHAADQVYIIADDGSFIYHEDTEKQWGGARDLNTGHSIFSEIDNVRDNTFSGEAGLLQLDNQLITYAKFYPGFGTEWAWTIVHVDDAQKVFSSVSSLIQNQFLMMIFIYILFTGVVIVLVRRILRPLKRLVAELQTSDTDGLKQVTELTTQDEIGTLSRALNKVITLAQESRKTLDGQVKEKTKALDDRVLDLQDAQKAMVNILDDIDADKQKLEAILTSIGDAVFVVDANQHIILCNRVCSEMSGYPPEEAIGKPYKEILRFEFEKDGSINDTFITQAFATGKVQAMANHTQLVTRDGRKIPVADSSAPIVAQDGRVVAVVVVFRDVTQEQAVDRAKTEFVSLASHQLRTPLTAINWFVEMLLDGDAGELTSKQKEILTDVHTSSTRMAELVSALLNVSRLELGTFAIHPMPVKLDGICSDTVKELSQKIQDKNLSVTQDCASNLGEYMGDKDLLYIIFQNLLSNAVKYTPDGGDVRVEVERREAEGKVVIRVQDTGYGIPADQQDQIFTKLFRADNVKAHDTTGTGLGLYIVRAILEAAGGNISFTSVEGEGTTFTAELPIEGMAARKGTKVLEK